MFFSFAFKFSHPCGWRKLCEEHVPTDWGSPTMTFPFASRQQDGRRGSDHCLGHCEPEHVRLRHQSLNLHLMDFV